MLALYDNGYVTEINAKYKFLSEAIQNLKIPLEAVIRARQKEGKQSREKLIKKNLMYMAATGATFGALSGVGYALYKQYHASSPDWLAQLAKLNDDNFAPNPAIIGGQSYLVSAQFHDTSHLTTDNCYELYFIPITEHLADNYLAIINTLAGLDPELRNCISYVAVRLVPFTSYYKPTILPRIIVQLAENITQAEANTILTALYNATKPFTWDKIGHAIAVRYMTIFLLLMAVATTNYCILNSLNAKVRGTGVPMMTWHTKIARRKGFLLTKNPNATVVLVV